MRTIGLAVAVMLPLLCAALPATASAPNPHRGAGPAGPQDLRLDSLTLALVVNDSAGRPLPAADIILTGRIGVVRERTDATGRAYWRGLAAGTYRAIVRRPGYRSASVELPLDANTGVYGVVLEANVPQSLAAMRVAAEAPAIARLAGFEDRRRRGEPSAVVTRADIERRNPIQLSQLLRGLPGIRLADSVGNRIAVSTRGQKMSRSGSGNGLVPCVMRVSVDGIPLSALANIDAMPPVVVYGIEVYNGPSRMPASMGGLRTDNWCGLIAIWTRDQ